MERQWNRKWSCTMAALLIGYICSESKILMNRQIINGNDTHLPVPLWQLLAAAYDAVLPRTKSLSVKSNWLVEKKDNRNESFA